MPKIEVVLKAEEKRFAIVVAKFNELITSKLLDGALDTLRQHGVKEENIDYVWVPGAFELPLAAKKLAQTSRYDGIICLGCVIRGATTHYDYVCSEAAKGISRVSLDQSLPVIFGVLTTENLEQAMERCGAKVGHKGREAASAALEMASFISKLS